MRIPSLDVDFVNLLLEFDIWVTPTLGEIRDTNKFRSSLLQIIYGFELLSKATNGFESIEICKPEHITCKILDLIEGFDIEQRENSLQAVALLMYLVTGKTDNNSKCQFPLFLRDNAKIETLPSVKKNSLIQKELPRVLKAEDFIKIITSLHNFREEQEKLLCRFIQFLLSDESYVSQLWSIGYAYSTLKKIGKESDLLSPLAIFQVRGSVTASEGHNPETLLRARMVEWGLEADYDFNINDIPLNQLVKNLPVSDKNLKTRAYDFILPFKSGTNDEKIFIQCQFYAGDSGSVSHKNVDQTRSTRDSTIKYYPKARFVEYLDGAGYFASLNGDLKKLIGMSDTYTYFQIRSTSIRLRRELQRINFLMPLEVEHAIFAVGTEINKVQEYLQNEGYSEIEIQRSINNAINKKIIANDGNNIMVIAERRETSRRYCLLDLIARNGTVLSPNDICGKLLIPGFGPFYGLTQNELVNIAVDSVPAIKEDWKDVKVAFNDIQWLINNRFVINA